MTGSIKTYSMIERVIGPDFGIHDEIPVTRIEHSHRHDYFQIQVNVSGQGRQHIGAAMHPLWPGALGFVLPYRAHRVWRSPGSRFFVINFHLDFLHPELEFDVLDLESVPLENAPELAPFLFQEALDFRLEGEDWAQVIAACCGMLQESSCLRLCSRELIRARLLLLLATVSRRYESELLRLARVRRRGSNRRESLRKVVRFIRQHLNGHVTLADAAAAAELSSSYLAQLIKSETGRTFTDLVTDRRMRMAQELLVHTSMRISDVADAVGFEDKAYFTRRFRQCCRLAPRAYRDRFSAATPA